MSFNWLTTTLSNYLGISSPSNIEIDDESIPQSPTNSSSKSKQKKALPSVHGLENLGNTCFFNASVQALLACPKFVDYIEILCKFHKQNSSHSTFTPYEPAEKNMVDSSSISQTKIFCELLYDLYDGTITSPKHLFEQLCAFHPSEFSSFTQSDAHESFNKMMEIIELEQICICAESESENVIHGMFDFINDNDENEEKKESEFERIKKIKNPFHGLLANEIKCTECNYSNELRQSSFTCLTLTLCDNINSTLQSVYLKDRMNAFEIAEDIDGYKCIYCECNGLINKIKKEIKNGQIMNEIEFIVLEQQYIELNEKLNKLQPDKPKKNGFHPHKNDHHKNGYYQHHISKKQRTKYQMDASKLKIFRTKAKKKQFVSRYPNILCIHLNRLQFGAKDGRFVCFEAVMSVNKNSAKNGMNGYDHFETDYHHRHSSEYLLMSVIMHHGNDCGGHYTIYKRRINGAIASEDIKWKSKQELRRIQDYSEWYHISDEFVHKVTIDQVLRCQAYMLFYQKNQI